MRLVTYFFEGTWRAGLISGERVVDAASAARAADLPAEIDWTSNRQIIQLSPDQQSKLEAAAHKLAPSRGLKLDEAVLGPPIPDPDKIICLGLNYRSHAEEAGLSIPTVPILFAKYRNALTGP